MRYFVLIFIFYGFMSTGWGNTSILLKQTGADLNLTPEITLQNSIKLDDPFLIQLYASYSVLNSSDEKFNLWIQKIFFKKYLEALKEIKDFKEEKVAMIVSASELYLLYKLEYFHNFFAKWVELVETKDFLNSPLAVSLDLVIAANLNEVLTKASIIMTPELEKILLKIKDHPAKVNITMQALNAIGKGEESVHWLGVVGHQHPFTLALAQSAVLYFAQKNMLGASGKILKTYWEPHIRLTEGEYNAEDLAYYFLTMARLLYQAQAYAESQKYFQLIPKSSKHFLTARSELMWVLLKQKNYSEAKGELATLEMDLFENKFMPEVFLVSTMVNILTCQFPLAKTSIDFFISHHKKWLKKIEENILSSNASPFIVNPIINNINLALSSLYREKSKLENHHELQSYLSLVENKLITTNDDYQRKVKEQWISQKKLLEKSIYKMSFARIEMLSRMRQLTMPNHTLDKNSEGQYKSATALRNQLSFPQDGVLWADDFFSMSADLKNYCQRRNIQ